jgi:hypothetical protein
MAAIIEDSRIESGTGYLLQLAVFNNMAQIHSIRFAIEEMFECLDVTKIFLAAAADEDSLTTTTTSSSRTLFKRRTHLNQPLTRQHDQKHRALTSFILRM